MLLNSFIENIYQEKNVLIIYKAWVYLNYYKNLIYCTEEVETIFPEIKVFIFVTVYYFKDNAKVKYHDKNLKIVQIL